MEKNTGKVREFRQSGKVGTMMRFTVSFTAITAYPAAITKKMVLLFLANCFLKTARK